MNIKVQCCGLVILLFIYFFYMQKRTLHLETEKAFMRAFWTSTICLALDICSVYMILKIERFPYWLTITVCKAYLVTLIGVGLMGLLYVCTDLSMFRQTHRKLIRGYEVFAILLCATIAIVPIQIYRNLDQGVVYTYGTAAGVTYVGAASMIFISIYLSIQHRREIHTRRGRAVLTWMGLWLFAAVLQFLFPKLLVVGFASAIGMLVLYVQFENPELNIEWMSGLYNQSAFIQYCEERYQKKIPFYAVAVILEPGVQEKPQNVSMEKMMMDRFALYRKVPDAVAFRVAEDELILTFKTMGQAKRGIGFLQEHGQWRHVLTEEGINGSHLFYLPDTTLTRNGKELLELVRYAEHNKISYQQEGPIEITELISQKMYRERWIEQQIVEAIEKDRVVVYYQPIYSTESKSFTSAEALVRILDEQGNILPPGDFIKIAEKNGSILEIGRIVFEKVCHFYQSCHLEQYGIQYIEVNLSVVQCSDQKLAEDFIGIMERYHMPASRINLEITESAAIRTREALGDNLKALLNYGVRFSLDDFGTGQSNLNYIVDMPVSIVKFDRNMTESYFEDGKTRYVMDAAMHMIHGMCLEIVSEGIETEKQFRVMEELGINYIQGFYFSRPLPEQDFLKRVQEQKSA